MRVGCFDNELCCICLSGRRRLFEEELEYKAIVKQYQWALKQRTMRDKRLYASVCLPLKPSKI